MKSKDLMSFPHCVFTKVENGIRYNEIRKVRDVEYPSGKVISSKN
jgi:hypothetical protein